MFLKKLTIRKFKWKNAFWPHLTTLNYSNEFFEENLEKSRHGVVVLCLALQLKGTRFESSHCYNLTLTINHRSPNWAGLKGALKKKKCSHNSKIYPSVTMFTKFVLKHITLPMTKGPKTLPSFRGTTLSSQTALTLRPQKWIINVRSEFSSHEYALIG